MSYANAKDTFEANFREASQLLPKETCESIIVSSRITGKAFKWTKFELKNGKGLLRDMGLLKETQLGAVVNLWLTEKLTIYSI